MIENMDHWGNSRHQHVRQQRPVVITGLPVVSTIEKLDPECPLKAGDTCRWQTFSIGKGFYTTQGHLTGRASHTVASGLEVEVQQDEGGSWKGFKKPAALTFSPLRTITGSLAEPTPIDSFTREIQGILKSSEVLCLPAPKVTGLLPAPKQNEPPQPIEVFGAQGFFTLYEPKKAFSNRILWAGVTVGTETERVTYHGNMNELKAHREKLLQSKCSVSEIHHDLPLADNLKYCYSWKSGREVQTLRKEYQQKVAA